MASTVEKLEVFGLDNFINKHQHELCKITVNQNKVAAFLQFDFDQGAIINDPADNFSKCGKLYELIQKKSKVKDFLEALKETGNEHVIEFIELADLSTPEKSLTSSRSTSSKMGLWFDIPEPIESFCGRADFLTQLHDKLKPRDDSQTEVTVLSQVKIVSGLGGIGKTETATQYIMKYRLFYNNFIWINAESESSMRNSFIKLASELNVPVKNAEGKSREINEIMKEIYRNICQGSESNLIVFDNAEDYQSCKEYFPISLHPDLKKMIVILATSRNQEWISPKGKIQVLPLDVLTDDESLEFILKELKIDDSLEFREESGEFIQLMGGLPLALQQAVAYIRQEKELRELEGTSYEISDYVQEFKLSMEKFLSFSPVPAPDSSPTVFVTWNVTFKKIQSLANGEEAVKILEILSFLYADKIPFSFLHSLIPQVELRNFSLALKLLQKYSLIKNNTKDLCLSIHRQLQFVILQYLEKCNDVSNVVMSIVDKCEVILKNIKLADSSDIFLNVHQIVNNQFDLIPVTEKFLIFMHEFGNALWRASRYSESLNLHQKVYNKRLQLLDENHEDTLASQSSIAMQLLKLGRYDESLSLHKEVLEKKEIHLGTDHPTTISTKHNMAVVLRRKKEYQESLEIFQQVLAQQTNILGEDHPSTLITLNQVALLHSTLGDLSKALTLYEVLEQKQSRIRGPDHKDVLSTKHNKGGVLYKMGRFEEAFRVFNEVYEKQKDILGENHLNRITTLGWIADTLKHLGKFKEALEMNQKVYEIRKTNLGEDHPHTVNVKTKIINVETKIREQNESLQ